MKSIAVKSDKETPVRTAVGHAAECIRKALETLDGANLASLARSQELLEQAVDDLKRATRSVEQNPARNPKGLRPLAASLRRDVERLSRVVDACSAFRRGMAARLGDAGIAYDASGRVPEQAAAETGRGLEV